MVQNAAKVELLRQQTIVQLLRSSHWSAQHLSDFVKELVKTGILTSDVAPEVTTLFREKGVRLPAACPTSAAHELVYHDFHAIEKAAPRGMLTESSLTSAGSNVQSSRFEQEFERLEMLGQGAFGEVWRVRSRVDQQEYAIKVVPYAFQEADGHLKHEALREVRTWSSIQHPNIARYHTAWVEVDTADNDVVIQSVEDNLATPPEQLQPISFTDDSLSRKTSLDDWSNGSSEGGVIFEASAAPGNHAPEASESNQQKWQDAQVVPHNVTKAIPRQRAKLYVQMELVRGGTLAEWIAQRNSAVASGAISTEEARSWAQQAEKIFKECVSAIDHIHSRGITHRDVKPANIFLTEDGGVRLGDFGLATVFENMLSADSEGETQLSLRNVVHTQGVGTPSYASPEQLSSKTYGAPTDIFPLGVILAELLQPVQTSMERARLFESLRDNRKIVTGPASTAADLALLLTSPAASDRPTAAEIVSFLSRQRDSPSVQNFSYCTNAIRDKDDFNQDEFNQELQDDSAGLQPVLLVD